MMSHQIGWFSAVSSLCSPSAFAQFQLGSPSAFAQFQLGSPSAFAWFRFGPALASLGSDSAPAWFRAALSNPHQKTLARRCANCSRVFCGFLAGLSFSLSGAPVEAPAREWTTQAGNVASSVTLRDASFESVVAGIVTISQSMADAVERIHVSGGSESRGEHGVS